MDNHRVCGEDGVEARVIWPKAEPAPLLLKKAPTEEREGTYG